MSTTAFNTLPKPIQEQLLAEFPDVAKVLQGIVIGGPTDACKKYTECPNLGEEPCDNLGY